LPRPGGGPYAARMRLCRLLALLVFGLALPAAPAGAEAMLARYEVRVAGMLVLRMEALFDLDGPRYLVRARIRSAGLAGALGSSDQITSAEGAWRGADPVPLRFLAEGSWRGSPRQVVLDYALPGRPQLRALEPPSGTEWEVVPEPLRHGTMDTLSALAKLARIVALTGRCDTEAAVFDGRRRADYTVRTAGTERLAPEGAFGGEALRCAFEGRVIAGFRTGHDPEEARRPHPATAWLARPLPGQAPLPVRVELASRWFGTVRVVLVGVQPLRQEVAEQRR